MNTLQYLLKTLQTKPCSRHNEKETFFKMESPVCLLSPEPQSLGSQEKQQLSGTDSCCIKHGVEKRETKNVNIAKFFEGFFLIPISAKKNPDSYRVIEQFRDLVIKKLHYKISSEIPVLNNKLEKLESELEKAIKPIDKKYLTLQIADIKQEIAKLKENPNSFEKLSEDKMYTLKMLFQTKEELMKEQGQNNLEIALRNINRKIQDVYFDFLNLVELFLPNEVIYEKDDQFKKKKCLNCDCANFITQSGIVYCVNCYSEISPEISLYSINRNNIYNTYAYEEKENFKKAMIRFQGKQKIKFPKDFFEKLDEYFESYGLPKGQEVREKKLRPDKELLLKALSERKFNKYYEDINLICHIYWGFELPDVSHMESKLLEDYEKFNEAYKRLKKDRKSSLNIQFLLYKLLKRNGFPCTKSDFKLMKTADILEYHERIYHEVCKELGW